MSDEWLAPVAREWVVELLGEQTLAEASVWADQMRGNTSRYWQETADPYHYVTVPPGMSYAQVTPPERGDAMTALAEFRQILRDPGADKARKQLALRFSLHIVQDLHQPLHVGNGRDRGGNSIRLRLGGKSTNLHRVWDSAIISSTGRSDALWLRKLQQLGLRQGMYSGAPGAPESWIDESAALRDRIYPKQVEIDTSYLEAHVRDVEQRLFLAGKRGAEYLNELFESNM